MAIALEFRYKMTFTTLWKLFLWYVRPFDLCNAPVTFERLVIYIFSKLLYKHDIQYFERVGSSQNNIVHVDTSKSCEVDKY